LRVEVGREVVFEPSDPATAQFQISGVTIGVQFHWQRKEDERFVGSLKLLQDGHSIVAINAVSIEDYLASVISSEMSAQSSLNLLKAHAVTSRSWLLAQLDKSRKLKAGAEKYETAFEDESRRIRWYDREDHELFDVCADDHCQRYQGVTKAYTGSVNQAVRETRGDVLTFNDEICDARFSKSCGGISEAFENAWEPVPHPYLVPVIDAPGPPEEYSLDFSIEEHAEQWIRNTPPAFCNTADARILSQVLLNYDQETHDFYRWKVEYTQDEISDLIRRKSGIDFGEIIDLVPEARGASARLIRLRIVGTRKTLAIGKDLEIRRTLSPSHLHSSAFVVDKVGDEGGIPGTFVLRGAGWGHGVGLCQIGAAVMGDMGYTPESILAHYFTGAQIKNVY
jgi:SpoIID/LytB domain protein